MKAQKSHLDSDKMNGVETFKEEVVTLQLVTTYLMEYSEDWSVSRLYLSEESLKALNHKAA